MEFAEEA